MDTQTLLNLGLVLLFVVVGDVVEHFLDDADERGGADAETDQEEHVVLA